MDNFSLHINKYLLKLGFVPNVKGCIYLREALAIVLSVDHLCNLKTEVYPIIAKHHDTSSENVEKNISNAIDRVFLRADLEVLHGVFGQIIDEIRGKPTVKEFLSYSKQNILSSLDQEVI